MNERRPVAASTPLSSLWNVAMRWFTELSHRALTNDRARRSVPRSWLRLAVETLDERVVLSAGDLDYSFDTDGKRTVAFDLGPNFKSDGAEACAVDAQGRIVVVGHATGGATNAPDDDFAVVRLNPNGTLDTTFNGNGKRTIRFTAAGTPSTDDASIVLIQPDGKILIGGSTNSLDGQTSFALARLNPDGSLDTTFGGDGLLAYDAISSLSGGIRDMVLQSDGSIVCFATLFNGSGAQNFTMVRFNSQGTETSVRSSPTGFFPSKAVTITGDKILVGGSTRLTGDTDIAVLRLNADLSYDKTFGNAGTAILAFDVLPGKDDGLDGLAVQPDGKIIVGGSAVSADAPSRVLAARLNADGTLDTTFGVGGKFVSQASLSDNDLNDLVLQPDGCIVLFGSFSGINYDFTAIRLLANGTIDYSFNGTGRQIIPFNIPGTETYDRGYAGVYSQGALYVVGLATFSNTNNDTDFGIVKLQAGLAADSVIGRDPTSGQWQVGQSDGTKFVNGLPATWPAATYVDVAEADVNGDGKLDFIGRNKSTGQWYASLSSFSGTYTTGNFGAAWSAATQWLDTRFGDVDNDGRADVVLRNKADGKIYVALSKGSNWGAATAWTAAWGLSTTWTDVQLADVTGDGRLDILGRNTANGQWNVGVSYLSSFQNSVWTTWALRTYANVLAADVTGDGKADLAFRDQNTGKVFVSASTGTKFAPAALFATWTMTTWLDVRAADFNNDGRADLFSRAGNQLFVDVSSGRSFAHTQWAVLPTSTWLYSLVGDFNGDGFLDVATRNASTGDWWVARSQKTKFAAPVRWGQWAPTINWQYVGAGVV
jgi:uncharacterized delta-60 repeat protein